MNIAIIIVQKSKNTEGLMLANLLIKIAEIEIFTFKKIPEGNLTDSFIEKGGVITNCDNNFDPAKKILKSIKSTQDKWDLILMT